MRWGRLWTERLHYNCNKNASTYVLAFLRPIGRRNSWVFLSHGADGAAARLGCGRDYARDGRFWRRSGRCALPRTASLPPRRGFRSHIVGSSTLSIAKPHSDCSLGWSATITHDRIAAPGADRAERVRFVPPIYAARTTRLSSLSSVGSLVHRGRRPYPSLTLPHPPGPSRSLPVPCSAGLDPAALARVCAKVSPEFGKRCEGS